MRPFLHPSKRQQLVTPQLQRIHPLHPLPARRRLMALARLIKQLRSL